MTAGKALRTGLRLPDQWRATRGLEIERNAFDEQLLDSPDERIFDFQAS